MNEMLACARKQQVTRKHQLINYILYQSNWIKILTTQLRLLNMSCKTS